MLSVAWHPKFKGSGGSHKVARVGRPITDYMLHVFVRLYCQHEILLYAALQSFACQCDLPARCSGYQSAIKKVITTKPKTVPKFAKSQL